MQARVRREVADEAVAFRLSKVTGPLDQRKLLLQIEGRAKLYAGHHIDFEHTARANSDAQAVVEGRA